MEKTRRIELWDHFLFEMSLLLFFLGKNYLCQSAENSSFQPNVRKNRPLVPRDSPHVEKNPEVRWVDLVMAINYWYFGGVIYLLPKTLVHSG